MKHTINLSPLRYAVHHCDRLNRLDHGFIVVTDEHISYHQWHNYSDGSPGGSADGVLAYVHVVDEHFIVGDINDKPIHVFHTFEELSQWAFKTFNPTIPKKPLKCCLPAYKRNDVQDHIKSIDKRLQFY